MSGNSFVRSISSRRLIGGVAVMLAVLAFGDLQRSGTAQGRAPSASSLDRVSATSPFQGCVPLDLEGRLSVDNYANAEVEPRLAVDPRTIGTSHVRLVGAWQQDRWSTGGARGLVAGYSNDGGKTWHRSKLPFSMCAPGGVYAQAASDPWVSIGPDGTVYAVGLAFTVVTTIPPTSEDGIAAATSSDGGKTWSNAQLIARDTGAVFSDKESVTADPRIPGTAYVVWDRTGEEGAQYAQPMWFSRTTDYGKTWSEPARITAIHGLSIGHQIVVDPRSGDLYDFFSQVKQGKAYCQPERENCANLPSFSNMSVSRSRDRGATWSSPTNIASSSAIGAGKTVKNPVRTGIRLPEAVIDRRDGTIYTIWQDDRFSKGKYDGIAISISRDHGKHWSTPRRVPSPAGIAAVTASLAITPQGRIGIGFYTLQMRKTGPSYLQSDYWFTSSPAGATQFSSPLHLAGPFNMLTAPYAKGFFVGDYEGIAAVGSSFELLFVKVNSGSTANRTDVIATRITP